MRSGGRWRGSVDGAGGLAPIAGEADDEWEAKEEACCRIMRKKLQGKMMGGGKGARKNFRDQAVLLLH